MRRLPMAAVVAAFCALVPATASAWGPTAHQHFTEVLASDPTIARLIRARGLDVTKLRYYSVEADKNMPVEWKSADWTNVSSFDQFKGVWLDSRPVADRTAGYLLHILADISTPVCHGPQGANRLCDAVTENSLELSSELLVTQMGMPAPAPGDLGNKTGSGGLVARTAALRDRIKTHEACPVCAQAGPMAKYWQKCSCCGDADQDNGIRVALVRDAWSSSLRFGALAFAAYLTYGRR